MARWQALALAWLQLTLAGPLWADPTAPEEYEVKAAYIHHFARLVQWPAEVVARHGTIRLCMVGVDPFGPALDPLRAESVEGRRWEIQSWSEDIGWEQCDIAFIGRSAASRLNRILAAIGNQPVLTVGDTQGFGEHGVIINFFPEGRRIHFEINVAASRHAGLTISSQLLKLARLLPRQGGGDD